MPSKSFQPDAIDYAEALTSINLLTPAKQIRFKATMMILQGVKIAYLEGQITNFSRLAFSKAKATAQKHATAPWE